MTAQPKTIKFDVSTPSIIGVTALVDEPDYQAFISGRKWSAVRTNSHAKTLYVIAHIKGRNVYLHRALLGINDGKIFVDHRNKNGLDNRRRNLRSCTHSENLCNRGKTVDNLSGYKGVSFCKRALNWFARIQIHGKKIHLGRFKSAKQAAIAYKKAARKYHGPFAFKPHTSKLFQNQALPKPGARKGEHHG